MKNLYIFLLLLVGVVGFGQKVVVKQTCATDQFMDGLKKSYPELKDRLDKMDKLITNKIKNKSPLNNSIITIPVVFFVVHDNMPLGIGTNITDDQVNSQLNVLNSNFSNVGIKFCLATKTGQTPINSINHINNVNLTNHTFADINNLLEAGRIATNIQVNQTRFLRIFVVKSINNSNIGGYAFFNASFSPLDCIVMRSDIFGDFNTFPNGNYLSNYNRGMSLVHEIGHYFGLYHTFHNSCLNDDCSSQGDLVCDTPPVNEPNFICNPNVNTCFESPDLPDKIDNFMDYTDDLCKSNFTSGQKDRMLNSINLFRSEMISVENQIYTGTCGSELLISANFIPSSSQICINNQITFTPLSFQTGLTYSWNFGDPNSGLNNVSNVNVPSHTYLVSSNSPFLVTLTISNGLQTQTFSEKIYVSNCNPILSSESNWRFGNYPDGRVNAINFNSGVPVTSIVNNFLSYKRTTALVSDNNGELLFSSNGQAICHNTTDFYPFVNNNGYNIANNGSIIIKNPNPQYPNQYYVFVKDGAYEPNVNHGFRYSLVNAPNSNNVTSPIIDRNLILSVPSNLGYLLSPDGGILGGTSVTAIAAQDGYWIITRGKKSTGYFLMVFKLTATGVVFVSEFQSSSNLETNDEQDFIDVSPNGDKIVVGVTFTFNSTGNTFVYSFDKFTGKILNKFSNNLGILRGRSSFSPNSNLLYISTIPFNGSVGFKNSFQCNLQDLNYDITKKSFGEEIFLGRFGDFQSGPDNKIYYNCSFENSTSNLQVIHYPNNIISLSSPNACSWDKNGPRFSVPLSIGSSALPNMINAKKQTAFETNAISSYPISCNTREFFPDSYGTTFNWNFGDPASGINNTYSGTVINHTFSNSGTFIVTLNSATNVFIAQTTVVIGIMPKTILGSSSACVSGLSNSSNITNNSVVLANGETAVWTVSGGTISGDNNQSDVTINWSALPGIITLTVTNGSGCITTTTKTIIPKLIVTPTFSQVAPVCSGSVLTSLPNLSNNFISGSWTPQLDNIFTTEYTFTPSSGFCSTTATMTIEVLPANDPACNTNPCLPNITLNAPEINSPIIYKRLSWIETNTNYVTATAQNITMKAGDYINLKAGTHIKSGSSYLGKIEACTATSKVSFQRFVNPEGIKNDEVSNAMITIFPNPTKESVTIASTNSKIKSIVVSSVDGKTCFLNTNINNEQFLLDASNYQNGIYIITIETIDGKIERQKLVKN